MQYLTEFDEKKNLASYRGHCAIGSIIGVGVGIVVSQVHAGVGIVVSQAHVLIFFCQAFHKPFNSLFLKDICLLGNAAGKQYIAVSVPLHIRHISICLHKSSKCVSKQ